jgi:transcriptional regulator with XRE-family HTH domain
VDEASRDSRPFAAQLLRYRLARQLTQEELAHRAGLSVRAVRNAESGRVRSPRTDSIDRLAGALQLSPGERTALFDAVRAVRVMLMPPLSPGGEGTIVVVMHYSVVDGEALLQIEASTAEGTCREALVLALPGTV